VSAVCQALLFKACGIEKFSEKMLGVTLELKMFKGFPVIIFSSDEKRDTGHKQSTPLVTHAASSSCSASTRVGAVPEANIANGTAFQLHSAQNTAHARMCRSLRRGVHRLREGAEGG
jgi:hypothetical protein